MSGNCPDFPVLCPGDTDIYLNSVHVTGHLLHVFYKLLSQGEKTELKRKFNKKEENETEAEDEVEKTQVQRSLN